METLEERIQRHEGFRSVPYQDSLGFWTVGFGHCITKNECTNYQQGISTSDALILLEHDISVAQLAVRSELPWASNLNEVQQGILVEMCFQLGINGLLQFKHMLQAAQNGDNDVVVSSMLASLWHKQTPNRCEELADLWSAS